MMAPPASLLPFIFSKVRCQSRWRRDPSNLSGGRTRRGNPDRSAATLRDCQNNEAMTPSGTSRSTPMKVVNNRRRGRFVGTLKKKGKTVTRNVLEGAGEKSPP